MRHPQTLKSLLTEDMYRDYFRRMPAPFAHSTPQFAIVAVTPSGKFGKTTRSTFKEAWAKAKTLTPEVGIMDVSIFIRNRVHPVPPFASALCRADEDWCRRCRRSSIFRIYGTTHPTLRDIPVMVEDQRRCFFCGINITYGGK